MATIKVRLLKPLDGKPIGATASYDAADVKRLEALGAVKRVETKAGASPAKKAPAPSNKMAASPRNKSA